MESFENIPISLLREGKYQARLIQPLKLDLRDDKNMVELYRSIEFHGVLSPILVRKLEGTEFYEVLDGGRRVEAAKYHKMEAIPAIIKQCNEEQAQLISIIGNLQRVNLTIIEKAIAFKKILDEGLFKDKKHLSMMIGKNQSYIGDIMNVLKMDERIIDDLSKNKSITDVRVLRLIRVMQRAEKNKSDEQWELYQKVINGNVSRDTFSELKGSKKKLRRNENRVVYTKYRVTINIGSPWTSEKREAFEKWLKSQN